jgi:protein-tyrosine phosphatase
MIDIHHHLLFGLDDGPPDLETSIAMARMAAADGITHVVCTPHASGMFEYNPALNAERIALLRDAIAAESIPLTIGMGCDFHLSYDNITDALAHPTKYSINATSYLLVELPDFGLPRTLTETFYQFQLSGITPILTHPERNPTLQKDTARLIDWLRNGLLVQVTAGSVLGHMGREAEQMSHRLLADRWVHFLATDAHNIESRPPQMRAAHDLVARRNGTAYANLLCFENPRAVFDGIPLGEQEPPRKLFEDHEEKKSWWKRLLRRQ